MATTLSWNVMLSLMITISPVTFGFLTHIPDEVSNQDSNDLLMHEENEREKEINNSLGHFFYFNISGLNVMEKVLEAQLRLYRMKTPAQEIHHTFFTSPSLILGTPDVHRLLSSHMVGAHSHGWEVFNVKEAVLDWVSGRRPNKGLLVTTTTLFEQNVDVKFARRNEHHNSKQPILVLFDDDTWPSASPLITFSDHQPDDPARRRRSLTSSTSTTASTTTASTTSATSTTTSTTPTPVNFIHRGRNIIAAATSTSGECQRYELVVDFERIGWSDWIIAPSNYTAYHCKGHCNFPLGQSLRPTNHATVQSIVNKFDLAPGVEKPCCVPTTLKSLKILYYDNNDSIVLRSYEDMIAESCGCH
ncbi:hypothetical protein C0J52_14636 [Blattella germanica]|nr:hypothetical protein C0J52_14636 [Blattella germanica]